MTQEEYFRNGLKFDSLEIRKEQENFNFNMSVFLTSWMMLELCPPTLVGVIIAIILTLVGVFYGLKWMVNLMKLDFIFIGTFIRFSESIGKALANIIYRTYKIFKK